MKRIHKLIISAILLAVGLGITIYSYFDDVGTYGIGNLLTFDWYHYVAVTVIVAYLLMKFYVEMTKQIKRGHPFSNVIVHLAISLLLASNVIFFQGPNNINVLRSALLIRYILLFGMVIVFEMYVFCQHSFLFRLLMGLLVLVTSAMTFMFDRHDLAMIIVIYYFMISVYMLINYNLWKDEDKIKLWAFYIVMASLIYDMLIVTNIVNLHEMSYVAVAIGLLIIYTRKIYDEFSRLRLSEQYLEQFKRENEKLIRDKVRSEQSFEKMKNEFSFKFSKKQNYFENLEMVIDVLDSSIVVMNNQFKIEFAHGKLLEYSGFDDLTGLDLVKTLYDDIEEGTYFQSVVKKIMNAEDEIRENMYLSLLDDTLEFSNIRFDMKYYTMKKKNKQKVLILQGDVNHENTAERLLVERENQISNMLIAVVAKSDMFFSDLEAYYLFCKEVDLFDDALSLEEITFKVLRRIHTFKGVFDQYHMRETCRALNNVEAELFNMLHNLSEVTIQQFSRILFGYELDKVINTDLEIINSRLGQSFLERKYTTSVNMTDLDRLVIAIGDELGHNHPLIKDLEMLQYVNILNVLKSYEKYVQRIAHENSKNVEFVVLGDSHRIDRKHYIHFFESILHIFKNCIAHGVEYPDERRAKGKSETATISCTVKTSETELVIEISDDGKGIDLKEIKNRLFILGRYTIEELEAFEDDFIANMILEDGVSSMALPNNLAGKGVGMGSIKEVIQSLNGHIDVKTEKDKGVSYRISLPKAYSEQDDFDLEVLHAAICLESESIITKKTRKSSLSSSWNMRKMNLGAEIFYDITVRVVFECSIKHTLIITADEKFLIHLINIYEMTSLYKGSNIKILNEALIKFAETIALGCNHSVGFRSTLNVQDGEILSESVLLDQYGHQEGYFASIDMTEGRLGVWLV